MGLVWFVDSKSKAVFLFILMVIICLVIKLLTKPGTCVWDQFESLWKFPFSGADNLIDLLGEGCER